MLNDNAEWDFIITKALKHCNIFQQWRIGDMPSPRDADASKNLGQLYTANCNISS